jgi:thiamine-phosphate pyrophosphorylase
MSALPTSSTEVRDRRVAGLYAVTPDLDDTDLMVALVDAALRGGAALVQYRNKSASPALRDQQARRLAALCAAHRRPLIINDHLELALAIDDAGLHVGREDVADVAALRDLREHLGPSRILGVSCYRSVDLAREAVAAGADYVAFGSMFASSTKPTAPAATLTLFAEARALGVPLVGIGGITRDNLASLIDAGCDSAAVIADLFATRDPSTVESRARAFAETFARSTRAST